MADVFAEQQKHYQMSKNERAKFDRLSLDIFPLPDKQRKECKPRPAVYEIECQYCHTKVMRKTNWAKYCNAACKHKKRERDEQARRKAIQ